MRRLALIAVALIVLAAASTATASTPATSAPTHGAIQCQVTITPSWYKTHLKLAFGISWVRPGHRYVASNGVGRLRANSVQRITILRTDGPGTRDILSPDVQRAGGMVDGFEPALTNVSIARSRLFGLGGAGKILKISDKLWIEEAGGQHRHCSVTAKLTIKLS